MDTLKNTVEAKIKISSQKIIASQLKTNYYQNVNNQFS